VVDQHFVGTVQAGDETGFAFFFALRRLSPFDDRFDFEITHSIGERERDRAASEFFAGRPDRRDRPGEGQVEQPFRPARRPQLGVGAAAFAGDDARISQLLRSLSVKPRPWKVQWIFDREVRWQPPKLTRLIRRLRWL
jgi:hypothetical protein